MTHFPHAAEELTQIYHSRFEGQAEYRTAVWRVLIDTVFATWVHPDARVLDLGAGRGEFINQIRAFQKFAMDLNPATAETLAPGVRFLEQDCSAPWPIEHGSLDLIFTCNFFEHLPDKKTMQGFNPPLWCVRLYCRLPFLWRLFGKQFIVILRKP